jgi:hypothetical protein
MTSLVDPTMNKNEWHEKGVCPVCKKLVYTYRHHKALCAHIVELNKKTEKSAQNVLTKANRLNQ